VGTLLRSFRRLHTVSDGDKRAQTKLSFGLVSAMKTSMPSSPAASGSCSAAEERHRKAGLGT
jgi:hypothetical protein